MWSERAPDVQLYAMSMIPPFPVPGHDGGFAFVTWGMAFCDTPEESAAALAPLEECPYIDQALMISGPQPTVMSEQYEFVKEIHPEPMRYRVDSAWVSGPSAEIVTSVEDLVAHRPAGAAAGHTFFQFSLPHPDAREMAMFLETGCLVGVYMIYDRPEDDELWRNWSLEAMKPVEPFTVGQYWGDSDQSP